MRDVKHWLALVLIAIFIIFAIQNMAQIHVNFLGFEFATSRIVLMVICVLIGFGIGKMVRFRRH
ncbi:DUF1049 domain-containing protein [Henriciella aquimarina]|uniref:DUF1049 domain-containing protein n=1 Tax=Henriciella aquimarina TaxID=545261 RepID=UPI001301DE86|nr:DUF1049 domain-containing protein [Henriciella aquimarina]